MSHLYQVGKLYSETRTSWPERADFNIRSGSPELRLFLNSPNGREIRAVNAGPAKFALFVDQPVIALCYSFLPDLPWSDAPFSMHLVAKALPEEATAPEIPQPFLERALVSVLLIDAATGLLKAIRAVTFSPEFTAELALAVRAQMELPWSEREFDAKLQSIYRRFSTTQDLVAGAIVRCQGGR